MNHHQNSYGLWSLVIINSLIFIFFAFSFAKPKTKTDWRSFGAFSGFIIALFVEMYGFPLTIYLFSGWLSKKIPNVDFFSHDYGHLWFTLLGWEGNPHFNPIHIFSDVIIIAGFFLLSSSWKVLYHAQKTKTLAIDGPYQYVRHPQYLAFILIMFGFLVQWPTLLTVLMFPILILMYVRLAKKEEAIVAEEFGNTYLDYKNITPSFIPKFRKYSLATRSGRKFTDE